MRSDVPYSHILRNEYIMNNPTASQINKLVIIGVGLIGGSFGLALRQTGMVRHITGIGRHPKNMRSALQLGVIDEIAIDYATALPDADLVFLAMPVGQTEQIMANIAPHVSTHSIITDAGSTKQDVIAAAIKHFKPEHLANFVPGHPIAGTEHSGAAAAQVDLYQDKQVVLTPLEQTQPNAVETVTQLWQACGANVSMMSADEHDKILAITSHLPHLLAFTMMRYLHHSTGNSENLLRFAGSGFRDFTRIAGSSPEMWRDICLANRDELLKQIDAYQSELKTVQKLLEQKDQDELEQVFYQARAIRQTWINKESQ